MKYRNLLILTCAFLAWQCQTAKPEIEFPITDLNQADLIPIPVSIEASGEAFGLDQFTGIYTSSDDEPLLEVAEFLSGRIQDQTGLRLPVNREDEAGIERFIYLTTADDTDQENKEAYSLSLNRDSVILSAADPEGIFRGVQTLRQLIPMTSNDTLAERRRISRLRIPKPIIPVMPGPI